MFSIFLNPHFYCSRNVTLINQPRHLRYNIWIIFRKGWGSTFGFASIYGNYLNFYLTCYSDSFEVSQEKDDFRAICRDKNDSFKLLRKLCNWSCKQRQKLKLKASYKIRSIYFIKEILTKKTKFIPFTFCYVDLKCLSINFSFSERTVILGRAFPSHVFFYLSPSNRIHCYEKQNYSFNLLLKFRTKN